MFALQLVLLSSWMGLSLSAEYFCSQFYENTTSRDFFRLTVDDTTPVGTTIKRFDQPWDPQSAVAFLAGDINYLSFDHENYEIKVISPLYPKIGHTLRLLGTCIDYIHLYNYEIKLDVRVLVYVNDVNNPPVFANLPNETLLSENSRVGSVVYQLTMDDHLDVEESFKTSVVEILSVTDSEGASLVHPFLLNDDLQVILHSPLDYEVGPKSYEITFYAEDGADPPLSNTSTLTVLVGDVDDMSPQFSHSTYKLQIIGERPIGEAECVDTEPTLVAVDGDGEASSPILYSIMQGSPSEYWSEYFELDNKSGKLCQRKTMPRLKRDPRSGRYAFYNFTFTVRAYQEDNPTKFDEAILSVGVSDSNEHAPEFGRKLYRVAVSEWPEVSNGQRLTQLNADDDDHGMNSEFEYSLSEDVADLLSIEPWTGWLVAKNATLFDRESWERMEFQVFAKETMTVEKKWSSARVQLTLEDANDNPPQFSSQHLEVSIKDTLRPGSMLVQKHESLTAIDLDAGDNGDLIYKLQEVERVGGRTSLVDHGRFTVDPDHGFVHLAGSLSDLRRHKQHPTYMLTISATDRARNESSRMSSTATMAVHVQEANDYPPVVTTVDGAKRNVFRVNESAAVGSIVSQLQVSDEDGDEDVYLKYRITDRQSRAVFAINSGGALLIKEPLDRESIPRFNFRVKITDGVHTVKTDVVVIVEDSNDNRPTFTQEEYRFTLKENPELAAEVGNVLATDPDSGLNGRVTYTLESREDSESFGISEDGSIFVSKSPEKLDRENVSAVKFRVKASDGGPTPLESFANVIVELEDTNDNVPIFSSPSYKGTLDEDDARPTPQIVSLDVPINATDGDADFRHRDIRYSLSGSGSRLFHMHPVRADIVVRKPGSLNCERKCSYMLQIHATDEGGKGTTVTSSLLLKLRDLNDEQPRFEGSRTFQVTDDTLGAIVGVIKAKDDDVTPPNNNVLYILRQGGYGKFTVDFNTGEVKVSADLDNEPVLSSYTLLVEAVDGGMPRQSQQTNITIHVPINTAPLIQDNATSFEVPENSALDSPIGEILATDDGVISQVYPGAPVPNNSPVTIKSGLSADPSERPPIPKLTYFIKDSKVPFSVDDRGVIKTRSSLDVETTSSYEFEVFVSDNGVPSRTSSAKVTVLVTDINDHPPRWLSPLYQGRVKEDNSIPLPDQKVTILSQNIKAVDDDKSSNETEIRYSLRGEGSQYFSVHSTTGQLSVGPLGVGNIDREKVPFFKFKVIATDARGEGLSSAADVILEVEDVNDVAPIFGQQQKDLVIDSEVTPGQIIGRLQALDGDATEPNNQVIYSLASDGMGKFSVDAETGSVVAQRGIYYQPRQESYVLEVIARDLGYPSLYATETVTVRVLQQNFNDFKPEFQGRTIFHTFEEVPVGTTVGRLNTVDEDIGPGEEVTLYINSEDQVPFSIDSETGVIVTTARLDCDGGAPRYFTFSVMARDHGDPPKTTTAYVGVIVDDINDNAPQFTQDIYEHSVSDVFPPHTIIATPFAFDDIDSSQTIYHYEMKGPGSDTYLHMDPDSGVVRTTDLIKTINSTKLEFELLATDVYNPNLKATALLRLTLYKSRGKPCCCLVPCEKKP